jgi:DNA repair exonuclease SbcCD ATPase subunit
VKRHQAREIGTVLNFEVSFFVRGGTSMKTLVRLAVLAVFLWTGTLVYCQQTQTAPAARVDSPLMEAAKKERERREKLKASTKETKTFTNQDIEDFKAKNKDADKSGEGEEATADDTSGTSEETTTSNSDAQNEQKWRDKSHEAVERVKDAEEKIQKLQTDINALTQAFYAESDGVAQRGQIEDQRNTRLNELEAAKKELENAKQAQEDLQDQARREGALPGWIEQQ